MPTAGCLHFSYRLDYLYSAYLNVLLGGPKLRASSGESVITPGRKNLDSDSRVTT